MSNSSGALENNEKLKDRIYTALNKSFENINDNVGMYGSRDLKVDSKN